MVKVLVCRWHMQLHCQLRRWRHCRDAGEVADLARERLKFRIEARNFVVARVARVRMWRRGMCQVQWRV